MNENDAEDSLRKAEYEDFKENAELKAVIAGQKAKKAIVDLNGIQIAIRGAIPKGLRDKLVHLSKAYQNGDVDQGDEDMYIVLSQCCIDDPWSNPKVWKYIDEETGEVPNVLRMVIEKITDVEAGEKRFRGKQ